MLKKKKYTENRHLGCNKNRNPRVYLKRSRKGDQKILYCYPKPRNLNACQQRPALQKNTEFC